MEFEIASIPAVKAFKDGEVVAEFIGAVPPARIEAFLNEIVPSEADRLAESGDEESLRKALELDPRQRPGGDRPRPAPAEPRRGRRGARGAEALPPRLRRRRAGGPRRALGRRRTEPAPTSFSGPSRPGTRAIPSEALEQLQDGLAAEQDADRKDQLRRVMVAIFTELGADHPLAARAPPPPGGRAELDSGAAGFAPAGRWARRPRSGSRAPRPPRSPRPPGRASR